MAENEQVVAVVVATCGLTQAEATLIVGKLWAAGFTITAMQDPAGTGPALPGEPDGTDVEERDMATKVYNLYRNYPDVGKSSYLHKHYRCGLINVQRPPPGYVAALAAWKAGRDTTDAAKKARSA